MDEESLSNLEAAYDILEEYDYGDIMALAERYIYDAPSLALKDIKALSAYIIINFIDY